VTAAVLFFASCGAPLFDLAGGSQKSASTRSITVHYQYGGCRYISPYSPLYAAVFGHDFTGDEPDLVFLSPPLVSPSGTCTFTGLQKLEYGLLLFVDCNRDGNPSTGEPYEFYDNAADNPAGIFLDSDKSVSVSFDDAYTWVNGFYENFDDGVADNWVDDGSGLWLLSGVNYVMQGGKTDSYTTSYYAEDFGDFTYHVSVEQNDGDPLGRRGIFFRASNPSGFKYGYLNGYVLWIDSNGNWGLERNTGALFITIANGPSGDLYTGIGSSNTITVQCYGSEIRIYFNGKSSPAYTGYDTMFSWGKVGIFGFDRNHGYPPDEFWFDDAWVN
jgi:hypothetical protein